VLGYTSAGGAWTGWNPSFERQLRARARCARDDACSSVLAEVAAELALFAALGFLLFSLDDLAVDLIYFAAGCGARLTVYRRHARGDARSLVRWRAEPGWMVVMIPAWDEAR
jgi:hypothetical protein